MFSLSLCLLCAIVFCLRAVTQQVMYMQALQGISSSYWVFQLLHCKGVLALTGFVFFHV